MAVVVYGGQNELDELISGDPHPGNFQLVENSQNQLPTNTLSQMGQHFADLARQTYEYFTESFAARKAKAASRAMKEQWELDTIRPLLDIGQLQHAPDTMLRYLMAEPNIRELYHQNQADGYRDRYTDQQPGVIGVDHYDYRRVTNGMVFEDDDGGWYFDEYAEDLEEGDRELYFVEQFEILRSWQAMAEAVFAKGDDPTSKWNNSL